MIHFIAESLEHRDILGRPQQKSQIPPQTPNFQHIFACISWNSSKNRTTPSHVDSESRMLSPRNTPQPPSSPPKPLHIKHFPDFITHPPPAPQRFVKLKFENRKSLKKSEKLGIAVQVGWSVRGVSGNSPIDQQCVPTAYEREIAPKLPEKSISPWIYGV